MKQLSRRRHVMRSSSDPAIRAELAAIVDRRLAVPLRPGRSGSGGASAG